MFWTSGILAEFSTFIMFPFLNFQNSARRSVLKAKASRVAPEAPAASGSAMKALAAQLQDPFNASIA